MPLPPRAPNPIQPITAPAALVGTAIRLPALGPATEHARRLLGDCGLESVDSAAGTPLSPALEWAGSGAMALTGPRDAAPRFAPGAPASAARGAGLALAALAPGTSLAELDAPALLGERAAIFGLTREGTRSAGGAARLLATRDGWIAVNLPRTEDWELVPAWLAGDEAPVEGDWARLGRALGSRGTAEIVARARLMGLAVAAAETPSETGARRWMRVSHASQIAPPPRAPSPSARVLDLSSLWAGPLAGSLLAMAGFEVRKVESPDRPDGARRGPRAFFDLLNGGKRVSALDLGEPRDRALFETLLEQADVVLESARPRALEQLGYDAANWVRGRPGRIWASITGYGREAPRRDWIAFGDDAAVAAGLAWPLSPTASATEGHPPLPCFCADAIADPLAGLHAAVAILGHWRAGRGGLLDLSLVDVSAGAATLASEHAALPVERSPGGGWHVVTDEGPVAIAAPRARRPRQSAPPLKRPSPQPGTLRSRRC
ncbi:MAG: CoA transferase [Deltaproteobacteria bacterium]|jgi:hypothetical protein|nr:CoA transferase [Deltaproteobacteria bacterium]MBW2495685.1 CoA transferase [Deltaproteobacteria bacterium]